MDGVYTQKIEHKGSVGVSVGISDEELVEQVKDILDHV